MPHHPEPFYRPSRKLWYVQIGKKQINLGRDEKEAWRKYHALMAEAGKEPPKPAAETSLAVVVVDLFLDWVQRHKSGRTYEWYRRHLTNFARGIDRALPTAKLRPHHVTGICDHSGWSDTTKNGFCRAVQRAFRWAERQGHIERSPLPEVEKPQPQDRDLVITQEEYERVIAVTRSPFRELLVMAWETGARPRELVAIEARHLDFEHGRIVFPVKESKGKKLPRVVYLTDPAMELARKLAGEHPRGAIFRNADGNP